MIAKWDGKCRKCGASYKAGESIRYSNLTKQTFCVGCWGGSAEHRTRDKEAMAQIMERATAAHAAARATEPVPADTTGADAFIAERNGHAAESPENGLGQAQPATLPVEPSAPSDAYLAPLAAALARHMNLPESTVNVDAVRTISEIVASRVVGEALRALEAPAPTVIEIRRPDAPAVTIEHAHYLMPRLLRLMGAGVHVYLWGPAGTGKTTAALQAAHALGKADSEIDTMDPSTPKSALLGYRTPTGDPVTTAFTRCYTAGQVYIGDELDNAPAAVQSIKNSALANGHAPTAWGMVPRGEGFVYVGTGNTPGRPTPAFPDRRPMSAAFADRLYFIHWPLDAAIECRVGGLKAPAAPAREESTCTPAEWVRWVQRTREWAATNAPTLQITPRASIIGIQALALGETPAEVAAGLVFRGADAALVSKTLAAVALPGA